MRPLNQLIESIVGADAAKETNPQAGLLSYAGEWHSLLIGAGAGVITTATGSLLPVTAVFCVALGLSGGKRVPKIKSRVAIKELRREPWYAVGGGIVTSAPVWVPMVVASPI